MKTCLYTLSYLDGLSPCGGARLDRNIKYVDYYKKIKEELGFDHFVFADNASSLENVYKFKNSIGLTDTVFHRFQEHLPRGAAYSYPYCWRGLNFIRLLIEDGYEKIIYIDSDGFILNSNLSEYVNQCDSGWEAFWCQKYQFPESAFHILNKDAFGIFDEYTKYGWKQLNGKMMETSLPFTLVNRDFNTDRFGENRTPQNDKMDFYGQCPVDMNMKYNLIGEV